MGVKKQRRISKSASVYVPVAVLLIVLLAVAGISVFFRVVDIEVTGASLYTKEEIVLASGIVMGDNMLFIKAGNILQKIYSAMPYISEASVEFLPPDIVRINIVESVPMASIRYPDGVLVIDSTCKILDKVDFVPAGLIEIKGFVPAGAVVGNALKADPGDDTRLKYIGEVLLAVEKEGIQGGVSYIDVSSISHVNFLYCNQFTVVLGTTDNIQYKMSILDEFIASRDMESSKDETGTIDMSIRGQWRFTPDR